MIRTINWRDGQSVVIHYILRDGCMGWLPEDRNDAYEKVGGCGD